MLQKVMVYVAFNHNYLDMTDTSISIKLVAPVSDTDLFLAEGF